MDEQPPNKPSGIGSFVLHQVKLGISTLTIATVATFTVTFWINASIIFLVIALIGIAASSYEETGANSRTYTTIYGPAEASGQLLSIPIKGPIEGASDSSEVESIFGSLTTTYGYDIKEEIEDAADSGEYDGIVLEINSPGGTIYGSKAISDGVKYFKDRTDKPVFASVQGIAASGSYWVAASADKIIADSGTGIGSIGVIAGPFTYFDKLLGIDGGILGGGVITQNGIEQHYITAGEGKDEGNPFRRLSDKERDIIQQGVNDSYDQFTDYIATRRKIDDATIRNTIGAHVYGEVQAKNLNLIDSEGSREDVYIDLAKAARIDRDFRVVSSHTQPDALTNLFGVIGGNTQKKKANTKPLACSGSVAVPLAYHGSISAYCQK